MHFCNKCNNMYYLKVGGEQQTEEANKLIYYCRNCGNENDTLSANNICVSSTAIKRDQQKYSTIINEFTKRDPTLPRTKTIRCPNQKCPSNNNDKEREVLYIRYDDTNMKYIYMCAHCDTKWKSNEQK